MMQSVIRRPQKFAAKNRKSGQNSAMENETSKLILKKKQKLGLKFKVLFSSSTVCLAYYYTKKVEKKSARAKQTNHKYCCINLSM